MADVLLAALAIVALVVVTCAVVAGTAWRRVRRHNEISARHPTRPPLRWLAAPDTCARLHRRLRIAMASVRAVIPPARRIRRRSASTLSVLAEDLELHAVELDHEIQIAWRRRGPEANALRASLAEQVNRMEELARRLTALARRHDQPDGEPSAVALARLADQLDALEAAHDEIARIETAAGLRTRVGA